MFEPKFFEVKVLQVGSKSRYHVGQKYKAKQPHFTSDFAVFTDFSNDGKMFGAKNVEVIKEITQQQFFEYSNLAAEMPKSDKTKRNEVHLLPEVLEQLQKLAKAANRSLKNYMETVLIEHVKEQKKKLS